jgi:hypothetical protein
MEAIVLLQIWFGGEALLVPMPDRQSCVEAIAEYPAGMASCWSPPSNSNTLGAALTKS